MYRFEHHLCKYCWDIKWLKKHYIFPTTLSIDEWRIDIHGCLPRELEVRGVLDPKTLPNYAYRDDGILLHKAIDSYVSKIIKNFYGEYIYNIEHVIIQYLWTVNNIIFLMNDYVIDIQSCKMDMYI